MKSKLLPLSTALALGSILLSSCAHQSQQARSGPLRPMFPNRIAIPVKDTTEPFFLKKNTMCPEAVTTLGLESKFTISVPAIPSGRLDANGKFPMKFEAYRVKIEPNFGGFKVVTFASGWIFDTGNGLFDGSEIIPLTPATSSEDFHENHIRFQLKSANGLTEGELLLFVGRAPSTGTETTEIPVYEAATFYTVKMP